MSQLLTYDEAAAILNVSRSTLIRQINRGLIPVVRIGERNPRIRREDIDHFIATITYVADGDQQ